MQANALRATLGVRPTPFPVAGAVSGTLHVTGPLEKPVFSGTAVAVRPRRWGREGAPAQGEHEQQSGTDMGRVIVCGGPC